MRTPTSVRQLRATLCDCRCHPEGFWAFDCCYPNCQHCAVCGKGVVDMATHRTICKAPTNDYFLRKDRFRLAHDDYDTQPGHRRCR